MARNASTHEELDLSPVTAEAPDQRLVFNGGSSGMQGSMTLRNNRPAKPRKRSPLMLIGSIACIAVLVVLYVWNKISVNHLMEEVNALEMQIEKLKSANNVLASEVDQKVRLDIISRRAKNLGMVAPKEPPVIFEIGSDVLDAARERDEAAR